MTAIAIKIFLSIVAFPERFFAYVFLSIISAGNAAGAGAEMMALRAMRNGVCAGE
jgi:hypothetical protein